MAGPGKGKNKKNKGKYDSVHGLGNKQHGTKSSNLAMGKELSDDISRSKKVGKKSSSSTSEYNSRMIEELLMEKVELLYKIALEKLMDLGYGMETATRALLMNGSIFGGKNILSNILSNTLATITKGQATNNTNFQPIFRNVRELARFSMQTLINMIVQDQSNTTKTDAILYLLQSDSLAVNESCSDSSHSKDHKDLGNEKGTSDIDIGKMLKENTTCLQKLSITIGTPSSSSSRRLVASFLSEQKITHPYIIRSESSSDAFESDSLEFMKSFTNFPDGMSLEDSLRTCEEDVEHDICLSLTEQVKELQKQVQERREWAKKRVIEAAKKFSATGMELKELRYDTKEIHGQLKQKDVLESRNSKISERKHHLRHVNHDYDSVNQVKSILEAKHKEYKSEIVAYNLGISESEKSYLKAQKSERKILKKSKDTEKHIEDFKRLIEEEKQKLAEMADSMEQVNEATEQAKVRLRQEKEAKEHARVLLLEEKRLNRLQKENSKKRLTSLRRELDMKYQKLMDEQKRLELELSQLKSQDSSKGSSSLLSSTADAAALDSQKCRSNQCSRHCIICRKGDVSVLFLPCAHQVICLNCNEEVYDALEDHCPCCKTVIERRVEVFGPNS